MNTQDFLSALEPHQNHPLIFDLGGRTVQMGYHVTEIKLLNVQAMDCGGQGAAWSETVVQLWVPDNAEQTPMSVRKFLDIYRRVAAHVPVQKGAELRIEYGDVGAPAISYLVRKVDREDKEVLVRLEPPLVACKAVERSLGNENLSVIAPTDCCSSDSAPDGQGACCG